MTKMIVEKSLGGSIEVHNGEAGAVFTMTLPRTGGGR
jgi:C4-dicarboxylate-specific signal transduction histidine kinase